VKGGDPLSKLTTTNVGISRRKPAGGDNGRNGQAGKHFYIFQPE
jgi:hypothetical protein